MAGLPKVAALEMTARQSNLLKKISGEYKRGIQEVKRIKILLKGGAGQSNYSIGKDLGVTVKTVEKWRKRWSEAYDNLLIYEKGKLGEGVTDSDLIQEMLKRVRDLPRSGKPPIITLSQKEQIVALACRCPSEYGLPLTDWSLGSLAKVAVREKIVESISSVYIGVILKK